MAAGTQIFFNDGRACWVKNEEKQDRKQLPNSRGVERSETGLATTALEGKLVKGE